MPKCSLSYEKIVQTSFVPRNIIKMDSCGYFKKNTFSSLKCSKCVYKE